MEQTTLPDYERGLTFEKVWASIQELKVENDRQSRKLREELQESSRLLDKKLSALGNRFGEMIEYLASPGLPDSFKILGYGFLQFCRDKEFKVENQLIAEADVFLESNDVAIVVEMKSKPDIDDIKDHIERMNKLRKYADDKGDKRKYYGALGGMVWNENEKNYALKSGFYVIEPSGNTFDVIAPTGDFGPREW